ncbi:hypothetical protein GGR56DRAFT_239999 [Xylariaceae sp. FL0804]|nr:hypothetical protein GGR56DRAFT_239999 [Xylariaceae sp. FL0804]
MAAPASKTIGNLSGKWLLNKTLSDPVDAALQLQGIGWLIRKAIGAAAVTLHVKQYVTEADGLVHIDIDQVATAGLKGTTERRTIDDRPREHKDWLFGSVRGRTRWVSADELAALLSADGGEARKGGWVDGDFLARDWLDGAEEKPTAEQGVPEGKRHLFSHVESLDNGWHGTQVWGFQTVQGERRYARNVCVAKGDKFVNIKMIYDYLGEV